ncbi:hypothetical protein GCM10027285_15710 [Oleiagrimonas citrea]|uniref:DUF2489 domain-containing protein n=1 Tax=Oleiagrimonas citrea TaxID=1665687 RepID=A0A846ZKM6_9GAMM|nr:hypothetical protein [Oleiagrimonas citrea]NKZ38109.1 hypothetical protein [Oleiagrimonas citrea]
MCWTEYISAIGIPIIAAIAAWIAFRQSQIARNKLKLDLFDKRMEVYSAVREALGCITRQGNLTQEQQLQYLQGTRTARWVFGIEVAHYLDEALWHKIVDLELHNTMSKEPSGPERTKHIQKRAEVFKWLVQQYKDFDALVAEYLELRH